MKLFPYTILPFQFVSFVSIHHRRNKFQPARKDICNIHIDAHTTGLQASPPSTRVCLSDTADPADITPATTCSELIFMQLSTDYYSTSTYIN